MQNLNTRTAPLSRSLLAFALLSGVAVLAAGCSDGSSMTTTRETTVQQSAPVPPPTTTTTTTRSTRSP